MTPEYTIVGLLVTAVTAMFALYQKGVNDLMKSKDGEIIWLREQIEPLLDATRTAVAAAEKFYASSSKTPASRRD